ncbi:MAG: (d)CMP kinase, partial [Marinirhabdus sp.]
KIAIAIDGFSSTGKSTVAKQLAEKLGYVYIDTGAMYRAVALFALRKGFITATSFNKTGLIGALPSVRLHFEKNGAAQKAEMFLNGENVEEHIRTLKVSNFVSPIATVPQVRKKLVQQQQRMGREKGVVVDGRDIGTVVFPNAELKIFMTAPAETRAKRRYHELLQRGRKVSYKDVLENVTARDRMDSAREDSPLKKAKGAIVMDNSQMSREEQLQRILQLAKQRIAAST